jgi:thioredoxin 1
MADLLIVNETNFEKEVIKSNLPVIVDFGAEWCAPCKQLEPLLGQILSQDWAGKARLVRLDVDQSVDVTMRYQVMQLPTVILFKNGQPVERFTGLQNRQRIVEKFGPHLQGN